MSYREKLAQMTPDELAHESARITRHQSYAVRIFVGALIVMLLALAAQLILLIVR